MLFVFDEADGIEPAYWTTTKSMFKAEAGHGWLAIGNPVSTTSAAALEELAIAPDGTPAWKVFNISALDHPNISSQLAGRDPPYPHAVTLPQVEQWLRDWCEPVPEKDLLDIEWPPAGFDKSVPRVWYRPGPIAEARMLGRRPSSGTYGIWSTRLFDLACRPQEFSDITKLPEIGCDVARFGDDWTAIHVRWGNLSLMHEAWNGWSVDKVAGRLKYWCRYAAEYHRRMQPQHATLTMPQQIRVKVDDDGVGGGVIDLADDYCFVPISAASKPMDQEGYPNKRSELWFQTALRAREGRVDFSRLPRDVQIRLRQQAVAPQWAMDGQGRRVVEKKEETKETIGRSPDDMDAANLAYYDGGGFLAPTTVIENRERRDLRPDQLAARRRGLFGR
jgi:hypothetical protein